MKKSVSRLFATTFLIALVVGILVSVIGWLLGWKTSVQFSNGLFISGGLIIVFGPLQGFAKILQSDLTTFACARCCETACLRACQFGVLSLVVEPVETHCSPVSLRKA